MKLLIVKDQYMIRHGVPLMQPGGSIVCVSSTAGTLPCAGLAPYAAAKAALEGGVISMTRSLALALGPTASRSNSLPGR